MTNPPLTAAVYYILLSLTEPLHGYGIMQKAEQLSSGRVRLAAGTLYGALNTLLEKGWIAAGPQEGRQKRRTGSSRPFVIFQNSRPSAQSLFNNLNAGGGKRILQPAGPPNAPSIPFCCPGNQSPGIRITIA